VRARKGETCGDVSRSIHGSNVLRALAVLRSRREDEDEDVKRSVRQDEGGRTLAATETVMTRTRVQEHERKREVTCETGKTSEGAPAQFVVGQSGGERGKRERETRK